MKMILKTLKTTVLSLFMAMLYVACSNEKVDPRIVLDNPTNEEITFIIDADSYTLKAGERQLINLTDGSHSLKVEGKEVSFQKTAEDGGSIINPTKSNYVLWTELYTDTEPNQSILRMMQQEITLDGESYTGPFAVVNDYYIKRGEGTSTLWKWGLDEELPDTYYTESMGSNFQFKLAKIFRASDFKVAIEKVMQE